MIIDIKTYKKYKNLKKLIDSYANAKKYISRDRLNNSKENYAKIKMNKDSSYTFLNNDKLCSMQFKIGEAYLSYVCSIYHRIIKSVDEKL